MSGNFRGASTLICLKLKGIKKDKLLFEIFNLKDLHEKMTLDDPFMKEFEP